MWKSNCIIFIETISLFIMEYLEYNDYQDTPIVLSVKGHDNDLCILLFVFPSIVQVITKI